MRKLLKIMMIMLFGVVLTYIASYGVEQALQYSNHYTGCIQFIFSLILGAIGFSICIIPIAQEN